jgi:uncharacterized membrane protein
VAAVFGLLFLIITPPFQTPDETVHFLRAYQVSEGNFVVDQIGNKSYGGNLPKSIGSTVDLTAEHPVLQFAANAKYNWYNTSRATSIRLNPSDKTTYDFSATAQYPPTDYAPQAIGIFIGRLFSAPPVVLDYLARLMNLVTWIVVFALVIRFLPIKKWAAVFIGLLPTALFEAISVSTDVVTIGSSALFIALVLRFIWQKHKITRQQLVLLLAVGAVMALSKQVMSLFLLFALAIPAKQFINKRQANLMKALIVALPVLVFMAWFLVVHKISLTATNAANNQDPVAQMKFILKNPWSFINVMWNTYFFSWGDTATRSVIGDFGWVDAPLSLGIVVVGYIGLFLMLTLDTSKKFVAWLTRPQKRLLALILLAYWLAVSAALYVYYSPVGFKIIVGLQGRYFLPMLVPAIALAHGRWLKTDKWIYRNIAIGLPLFLLICSVLTIYFRYYINNV